MDLMVWLWALVALSVLPRNSNTAQQIRCRHNMHDYYDGEPYEPWHFHVYCCDRCGKKFEI